MSVTENQTLTLHGHSVTYLQKGSGPVLLLIHGMAGSLETWRSDVLTTLGHERATLVGHSLGGGIAMQFSYQFPEMTERLVLVSSGGLGLEVNPVLRAASLPGANLFLSVTAEATRRASGFAGRVLRAAHSPSRPGLDELVRSYASLADADRRSAFLATVRSVVGLSGQTVRAGDRLYLARDLPVLLIWGADDPIIPVDHARAAHELLPDSTLAVFDGVRHFPHVEAPQRFVEALEDFCARTDPVVFDAAAWRARMRVTQAPD
jgi:pimeloyl-ACP methyl ester carboxylesterase